MTPEEGILSAKAYRRECYLKHHYGLTPQRYEEMLHAQKGMCAICDTKPGMRELGVDHDHATGKVRALLCMSCNTGLGMFRDNPVLLRRAAKYLRELTQ